MASRISGRHLALVVAGGAVGTAARAALLLIDAPGWSVVAVPVINVVGAFGLGLLTGWLTARADSAASRDLRQAVGTGVLGGFTTYSTFALEGASGASVALTVGTAVVGVAAAWAGLALTARRRA